MQSIATTNTRSERRNVIPLLRRQAGFHWILVDVSDSTQDFIVVVQANFPAAIDPRRRHMIVCTILITFKQMQVCFAQLARCGPFEVTDPIFGVELVSSKEYGAIPCPKTPAPQSSLAPQPERDFQQWPIVADRQQRAVGRGDTALCRDRVVHAQ